MKETQNEIKDTIINEDLITYVPSITIESRLKSFNRTYQKALRNNEYPGDILGHRIVYWDPDDSKKYVAYMILNSFKENYRYNKIKDYVLFPKENGYSSLHLRTSEFELQIRSSKMDYDAKWGASSGYHTNSAVNKICPIVLLNNP